MTRVLGIETTCDETSAAIVELDSKREQPTLLGQIVLSQIAAHRPFGGVVPEIACRSHVESLTAVIEETLKSAKVSAREIDAIAVAAKPGLIGSLLVGVSTAKALAWSWNKPLVAVDHIEAHLRAPLLSGANLQPPHLGAVFSGGHTELYWVESEQKQQLGATQDDAIGEAFDKVATILGLPYPGGPQIEQLAREGDPSVVDLPRTLLGRDSLDFSLSGLKTAVLYKLRGQDAKSPKPLAGAPKIADLAAAFQTAVADVVVEKLKRAIRQTNCSRLVFGGGVMANRYLRERIESALTGFCRQRGLGEVELAFPSLEFSTDNGAMIALYGAEEFLAGRTAELDLEPVAT